MLSPRPGFYGPVTATLDWCEANYQFSYYVAEMANSLSNLFTIALAAEGTRNALKEGLPSRYAVGQLGVSIVGIGSLAFHATLLYEAQLADELPMIYVAAMSLWLLFDRRPGYDYDSLRSKLQVVVLVLFNVLFTWSYYLYRNPVYHQVVFGILAITSTLRVIYLLRWSDSRERVPAQQREDIARIFGAGAGMFVLGFLIWNIDNICCDTLTQWKVQLDWPLAFLLEGHAWWHLLTGLGTYLMAIGVQCRFFSIFYGVSYQFSDATLCIKDDHRNFTLSYRSGLPYMRRVHEAKKQ